jgi:hypothetical protein
MLPEGRYVLRQPDGLSPQQPEALGTHATLMTLAQQQAATGMDSADIE